PEAEEPLELVSNENFTKITGSYSRAKLRRTAREFKCIEIVFTSLLSPQEIDFSIQAIMIPEVFRPGGEHCLVFLMTELPDFDFLAVGSLQSFAGVDEPFSVFRSPRHSRPIPELVALQFQQLIVQPIANHVDPV